MLPPSLTTMMFDNESALSEFIASLKIPTQLLIDQDTFHASLEAFMLKNNFHHTIWVKENYHLKQCQEALALGSLLVEPTELDSLQWWWNRTTILSSKIKSEVLPQQGIIAVFNSSARPMEKSWPQMFSQYAQLHNQQSLSMQATDWALMDMNKKESLFSKTDCLSTLVFTDLEKISPLQLRHSLTEWNDFAQKKDCRIVLDVQNSQVLFEMLLDWNTLDSRQGLYRLQGNRMKTQSKTSFTGMLTLCSYPLSLEYVRYTWLAGQTIS